MNAELLPKEFKFHGRQTVHRGRSFDFVTEEVTLDTGRRVSLEAIEHPGASAIVAITEAREVVLLRQYRHALGEYIWEIPAGTREDREEPLVCARRELIEEAGYQADRWDSLGLVLPAPGYSDEKLHLFLARDLSPAVQSLDEDELLDVHLKPLARAVEMVYDGEIQDAIAIAGLLRAQRVLSIVS